MNTKATSKQGRTFEKRVGHLFTLLGYCVSHDRLIGGRQVDLIIEEARGPLARSYIVECKDQVKPVNTTQYDSFRGRLAAAKKELGAKTQGIMVASVGFVKEAFAQSAHEEIQLITISELERSIIDFRQYTNDLVNVLKLDPSLKFFIEPNIRREYMTVPIRASEYIQRWLANPITNQLTLLGDYGTGKTTLLKHLALKMADDYIIKSLESGAYLRVPILIDLRDHAKALSLRQLILDFLDSNSIRLTSYAAFEYMLNEGHVLLMVDGFDEMASRGDPQATLRNFRELNRAAKGKAKIILSCRTHYFTNEIELQRHHGIITGMHLEGQTYTDLYREIVARPNFTIIHLIDFNDNQVNEYLCLRCGNRSEEVASFIKDNYNLPELSRRPVMLDMIVFSHGKLKSIAGAVTASELYSVYTDIWLTRNDWCNIIDVQTKCTLLELFAYKVSKNPSSHLHFTEFHSLIKTWRSDVIQVQAEEIDRELRTASFLVRDKEGNYKFSHKSFYEYFYARFLIRNAASGNTSFWSNGYFTTEIYRFLKGLLQSDSNTAETILNWILNKNLNDYVRANVIKCLGGLNLENISDILIKVLKSDEQDRVRWSAATALRHYPCKEVTSQLISSFCEDLSIYVRSNSLASLARINSTNAIEFLHKFLDSKDAKGLGDKIIREYFYSALKNCKDNNIIRKAIKKAPIRANPETIRRVLELCKQLNCNEATAYCERLLSITQSPVMTSMAFSLLSPKLRFPFLNKVFRFIDSYSGFSRGLFLPALIDGLRGLHTIAVRNFLISLIAKKYYSFVPTALDILKQEYPEAIKEHGPQWIIAKNIPYKSRLSIARAYAEIEGDRSINNLSQLLAIKERVVVRRTALDLIRKHCPNCIARSIMRLWEEGVIPPALVQESLEMLLRIDKKSAMSLILKRGLSSPRTGMRFSVCRVLGQINSSVSTQALLNILRKDHIVAIRKQALCSLCAPGRDVSKSEIISATEKEHDRNVLKLRLELLGD